MDGYIQALRDRLIFSVRYQRRWRDCSQQRQPLRKGCTTLTRRPRAIRWCRQGRAHYDEAARQKTQRDAAERRLGSRLRYPTKLRTSRATRKQDQQSPSKIGVGRERSSPGTRSDGELSTDAMRPGCPTRLQYIDRSITSPKPRPVIRTSWSVQRSLPPCRYPRFPPRSQDNVKVAAARTQAPVAKPNATKYKPAVAARADVLVRYPFVDDLAGVEGGGVRGVLHRATPNIPLQNLAKREIRRGKHRIAAHGERKP